MKKEKINPIVTLSNIVCAVLLIVMVALLFLPTWQYNDGMLSAASYIGFPTDRISLLRDFKNALGMPKLPGVNDVVTVPICVMLLTIVGLLFAALSKKTPYSAATALFAGILAVVGYATNPFFGLAQTQLVLIISGGVAAVAGAVFIALYVVSAVKNAKEEQAAQ